MKILYTILAAVLSLPLFALRPGDQAVPLEPVKWLRGAPPLMVTTEDETVRTPLTAVIFFLHRNSGSARALDMLEELSRGSGDRLRIAVISPEPESDVAAAIKERPVSSISYGVDTERQLTARYMSGSMLYPMAFVLSPTGRIIWCGEAVDLPEMLENYYTGNFDASKQKEISRLLDEMMQLLRDTSDRRIRMTAERIFELDPGNAAALRIRLFMLENSEQISEAWSLIFSQLAEAPQLARLYFSALDLISRYPKLETELAPTIKRFSENITSLPARQTMIWTLLNSFPLSTDALRGAVELQAAAEKSLVDNPIQATAAIRASLASSRALLYYRLGDLPAAINAQDEATALWKRDGSTAAIADSEQRADFYREALKLAGEMQK